MSLAPAWDELTEIANGFLSTLPSLTVGIAVFIVFYVAGKLVRGAVRKVNARSEQRRNLGVVLGRLAQAGVVLLGLLIALLIIFPSFKAGDLIQLLGISSVAIGFAFRDILQNFLAGILILLTEPFRIDDQIIYGDFEGTVDAINTRATTIRTYDGRRVVIPNAELFTNPVTVITAFATRRLEYDIGIGYGDDVARAKELILEAMRSVDGVLDDPAPDVLVVDLAASSVNLRARWWIQPPRRADALDLRDRVLQAVKSTLSANGVDLPFPTQQMLFHDQTEERDGDRARPREGWPAENGKPPRPRGIADALTRLNSPRPPTEPRDNEGAR